MITYILLLIWSMLGAGLYGSAVTSYNASHWTRKQHILAGLVAGPAVWIFAAIFFIIIKPVHDAYNWLWNFLGEFDK